MSAGSLSSSFETYELLEVLGDAILDYLINGNIAKYTVLEKYNYRERLAR